MSWLPELSERRQRQVLGVLLAAFAGLLAASLATYRPPAGDARAWAEPNACGPLGAWLAHALSGFFGRAAAWGIPVLCGALAWNRLRAEPTKPFWVRAAAVGLLAVEALSLIGLFGEAARPIAGGLGVGLADAMRSALGTAGGAIVLSALFTVTGLVASELGFSAMSVAWGWLVREPLRSLFGRAGGHVEAAATEPRASRAARPREARGGAENALAVSGLAPNGATRAAAAPPPPVRIVTPKAHVAEGAARESERRDPEKRVSVRPEEAKSPRRPEPEPAPGNGAALPAHARAIEAAGAAPSDEGGAASPPLATASGVAVSNPAKPARGKSEELAKGVAYSGGLPPLEMLEFKRDTTAGVKEDELKAEARLLATKLGDFGIRGAVTEVHPGPVITTFEFEPAPGIKVNQIVSREDDLALAMRASRIRILAPIPGKGAVGVEIPNRTPRKVYLREVLSSEAYTRLPASLKYALGVDVNGNPVGADLSKMPHLLVAGATGSGKSVYLNVLVTSLLFGNGPDRLRFLMIDPKMIELTGYNGIPHLLMPVITDAKRAAKALRWAVGEMERRYRVLATCGARNIDSLNEKVGSSRPPTTPEGEPIGALPYIVVLVDELADLMLTMPVEMEEPIGRLAQMARAVGIHLVLATQRPSVDVLTGVIKANFPSRIAFQVSSKTDSRTILDMNGAENLLGMGDMLYLPAGRAEPLRVHAPFITESEATLVADFWREKVPAAATAAAGIEDAVERSASDAGEDEDDDELVPEAVRLVVLHQQGSTSLLQRRLKVGYSRASRLMDKLENMGVVGPFMGSKARDVLVDEAYLEEHNLR